MVVGRARPAFVPPPSSAVRRGDMGMSAHTAYGVQGGFDPYMSTRKRALDFAASAGAYGAVRAYAPTAPSYGPGVYANRGGCGVPHAPPGGPPGMPFRRGMQQQQIQPVKPPEPPVPVRWITMPPDAPLVLERGLPELAPALNHTEGDSQEIMSASKNILYEILGGETDLDVEYIDDPDCVQCPEVMEAIQAAGGKEDSICIAICPSQGKWAVGCGHGWKKREQVARLALAVALAANIEDFRKLALAYPDFARYAQAAGIETDGALEGLELAAPMSKRARKKANAAATDAGDADEGASDNAQVLSGGGSGLPRDMAFFTQFPEGVEPDAKVEAIPLDLILVVSTEGTRKKGLYNQAPAAIARILAAESLTGNEEDDKAALAATEGDVEYHDDANWAEFPNVGKALKQVAPVEECLTVAVCEKKGIWAVGVGNKGKSRWAAVRLAMAAALAVQALEAGEEVDLSDFSGLSEFVSEAMEAKAAYVSGG